MDSAIASLVDSLAPARLGRLEATCSERSGTGPANEGDVVTGIFGLPGPSATERKTRTVPLLLIAPLCSLLLSAVLYVALLPLLPEHIVRHVGPDGVGFSSMVLVLTIMLAAAVIPFLIGGMLGRGFFRDRHWHPTQKFVTVAFMSTGYGILGVVVATILSLMGMEQDDVSGNSVAMGLLGFLLLFVAAAFTYALLFPRATPEPIPQS